MATLLQMISQVCQRTGVRVPTQVIGNIDDQIIQMLGLAHEVVEDMIARPMTTWQRLNKEAVFTTVAAENQGALTTLAPFGFKNFLNETIYSRTQQLPSYGPLTPQEWQMVQAIPASGPYYRYRVWQGQLHLYPAPPAGHTYAFEYASDYAILDSDGVTYKDTFTNDADVLVLPQNVFKRGLRAKWKKEKGLEYDEDFMEYQLLLANAVARDKPAQTLSGDPDRNKNAIMPGIFIQPGSWNLP